MSDQLLLYMAEKPSVRITVVVSAFVIFVLATFWLCFLNLGRPFSKLSEVADAYIKFCWACFLKPYSAQSTNQQDALESFYKAQANIYDKTRGLLLQGREDMLGLVAAQLKTKSETLGRKPIWVDVRHELDLELTHLR